MDLSGKSSGTDLWHVAHGGVRGSSALIVGAMALAGAAALGLIAAAAVALSGEAAALAATADMAWILVAGTIAWGLMAAGVGPVVSRLAVVAGAAYACEAVVRLVAIVAVPQPLVTLTAVAAGRLVLLGAFALCERNVLGQDPAQRLVKVAVAHAAAVVAVASVAPPGARPLIGQILDMVFSIALAAPLWQAAQNLREAEAAWAAEHLLENEDIGLEAFNNPDHEHLVRQ